MKRSENLNDLAAALAKAQGEMENAAKDKTNPHFRSKYADLGNIWDAIRVPLSKHGLSVLQFPAMDEQGRVCLDTIIMHSSGQFIEATYALPATKNDAQGLGSAITYMKRYALTGVGVAPEDDDGEGSVARSGHHAPASPVTPEGVRSLPQPDRKSKANAWGNAALDAIATMDGETFGAWRLKYASAVSEVRDFNEALHKRLSDAILKRSLELSRIATAAE